MTLLYCINDRGFEDVLVAGWAYAVEVMAAGAVRVTLDDGSTLVCCADRFAREVPR